jgi:hypothetical protein
VHVVSCKLSTIIDSWLEATLWKVITSILSSRSGGVVVTCVFISYQFGCFVDIGVFYVLTGGDMLSCFRGFRFRYPIVCFLVCVVLLLVIGTVILIFSAVYWYSCCKVMCCFSFCLCFWYSVQFCNWEFKTKDLIHCTNNRQWNKDNQETYHRI